MMDPLTPAREEELKSFLDENAIKELKEEMKRAAEWRREFQEAHAKIRRGLDRMREYLDQMQPRSARKERPHAPTPEALQARKRCLIRHKTAQQHLIIP